ncbi:tRNA pseudouridine(55) synthase TruB [Soehngenia longivitae]|uniref:tRNA pseudouridine synthase B n=1 Tax=Soehngenia longivitae TaxID=2562294 RepID=A0A4Z0D596_9FIRM|nr:tRNA pseudouridine(55) synthase TruB [Soehngenia longivitae]TFZ39814.1 tRNA pseudouridine(55) synthase TruB [Soehngenia longivitae]
MNGVLNYYKPSGITSHDAVNIVRKIMNTKKVGHIGTLDPMACGVLPMLVGNATRISEYLIEHDKEYIAELTLGLRTDTYDKEGKPIAQSDVTVTSEQIVDVFKQFEGQIKQIPPMFSSKKINGKKLYELARMGKEIDRKPNIVDIKKLNIMNIIDNKKIIFRVKCSKGTYIRSLCDDIGMKIGTFGYMSFLQRVQVSNFKIENSINDDLLKDLKQKDTKKDFLIPIDKAIDYMDSINVNEEYFKKLCNGNSIPIKQRQNFIPNTNLRVYSNHIFVGIGQINIENNNAILKMKKVLLGDN